MSERLVSKTRRITVADASERVAPAAGAPPLETVPASRGAKVVEAYPHEYGPGTIAGASVYMGTVSLFSRAGFREAARRSERRPILRLTP